MPFIPTTDVEFQEMLGTIGVKDFNELITRIPQEIRLTHDINLPEKLSEYEVTKLLEHYASQNISASSHVCFMGGGSYDHFIPALVGFVLDKPEFKTAYTPYQAEVSQGTLQAMYEYQSMVCALTGMDVTNASLYDGATAIAEACFLAGAHTRRTEFLFAGTINPQFKKVVESTCKGKNYTFKSCIAGDGTCDVDALKAAITPQTAAIIVQQPNALGNLEDVHTIEKITHANKSLFIVSVDPISLGILQPPGQYNADIVVGEGQALGIPMCYGGPYLGLFAAKSEFVRKIPGRISGVTQDIDGKRGFVLTLQTREQQIKREKATSNICSNQGLMMLAATVYMATLGKSGIKEVAELCLRKAHYLSAKIAAMPGFSLLNDKPFFKEFLVQTPVPAAEIIAEAERNGILAGIDTARFPDCKQGLLIAVTEKRTVEEMDRFVDVLKKFVK